MVRHEHAPESSYSNLPVSANHSIINRGTSHIKPPLPLPRTNVIAASMHSEKRSDDDYDYAETRMTDSYVEVHEYDDTSLLNGVKCYYDCIASTKIAGYFFQFKDPSRTNINMNEEMFDRAGIYVPTLVREKILSA